MPRLNARGQAHGLHPAFAPNDPANRALVDLKLFGQRGLRDVAFQVERPDVCNLSAGKLGSVFLVPAIVSQETSAASCVAPRQVRGDHDSFSTASTSTFPAQPFLSFRRWSDYGQAIKHLAHKIGRCEDWRAEGGLVIPASNQAVSHGSYGHPVIVRREHEWFASDELSCARIVRLFRARRPAHVAWFIVSVVVDAVNGMARRWSRTDVAKKSLKGTSPFIADTNAAASVKSEGWIPWVSTSLFDPCPCLVLAAVCHEM
jgi:hypothetical protein